MRYAIDKKKQYVIITTFIVLIVAGIIFFSKDNEEKIMLEEHKSITAEENDIIKNECTAKAKKAIDDINKATACVNGDEFSKSSRLNLDSNNSSSLASNPWSEFPIPSKPASVKPEVKPINLNKPPESEKKKVWVVDKPAWTEIVKVPVYASRPRWFINFGDGNIEYYYDKQEWVNECKFAANVIQWGNADAEKYISHYVDEYVEHPEEGHWEYR